MVEMNVDAAYPLAILAKCVIGGAHDGDQETAHKIIGHELGAVCTHASLSPNLNLGGKKQKAQEQQGFKACLQRSSDNCHLFIVWTNR